MKNKLPIEERMEQLKPLKILEVKFDELQDFFDKRIKEHLEKNKHKQKEKEKKKTALQINLENAINDYIRVFVKKHGYEFSYWVSGEVGGIACFIDQYYFNFDDIRNDIDKKVKRELIFKKQDKEVDRHFKK